MDAPRNGIATVTRYLLDTNHLSAALAPVSSVRERIYQRQLQGDRFGVCVPILCELQAGIQGLARREPCLQQLRRLMRFVRVWPLEPAIADQYGALFLELRRAGRVLSQIDMLQAALLRADPMILLTTDRDFAALPDIHTEDWT